MSNTKDIFIALLRNAVTDEVEKIDLSDTNYEALYSLSKFHDLAHIVYYELSKQIEHWEGDNYRKFRQSCDMALFRHIKREPAIDLVREILKNAGISFILLKGSYLMNLYPEPWMRTSSDIDVLVNKEDINRAILLFCDRGMVRVGEEENHDYSFSTQEGYHVELHYSLIEDFVFEERLPGVSAVLASVWDHAIPAAGRWERTLSDEFLYFYHIAHMAKHFKTGGCGVRSFIDLWLLNHAVPHDPERRQKLIDESGLSVFTRHAVELSERWFSGSEYRTTPDDFEEYVIRGGIYGSLEHSVALRKNKAKNRFSYYMSRIFQPYIVIKNSYPVLNRYPVLLPACWVARWFKLLDPRKRKRALSEVRVETSTGRGDVRRMEELMTRLGI